MSYSDQTLKDYLAGKLSDMRAKELENDLLVDPALERRLMGLDGAAVAVKYAFARADIDSRSDPIKERLLSEPKGRFLGKTPVVAAGLAAALAVGVFLGTMVSGPQEAQANWLDYAAQYQSLYVTETVAAAAANNPLLEEQIATAAERIDLPMQAADLKGVDDLTLARAQVLGFQGRPLIQVAFLDTQGAPYALCIMANKNSSVAEAAVKRFGMATQSWASDSHTFILIGGDDLGRTSKLASEFQRRLGS